MAKGNMLQGMARGKVGDVVFSRLNGEQVSRVRNRHPKNPRSNKQLIQRAIMATIMQAYSAGRDIFDHSFEGLSTGAECQRAFLSANAKALRSALAADFANGDSNHLRAMVNAPGTKTPVPNLYTISRGQLVNSFVTITGATAAQPRALVSFVAPLADETYAAYFKRAGIQPGDIFTFCFYGLNSDDEQVFAVRGASAGGVQLAGMFGFVQLMVKTPDDLTATIAEDAEVLSIMDVYKTGNVVDIPFEAIELREERDLVSCINISDNNYDIFAVGCILSRDNEKYRSTESMKWALYNRFEGISWEYLLAAWKQGAQSIGDSDLILEGSEFGFAAAAPVGPTDPEITSVDYSGQGITLVPGAGQTWPDSPRNWMRLTVNAQNANGLTAAIYKNGAVFEGMSRTIADGQARLEIGDQEGTQTYTLAGCSIVLLDGNTIVQTWASYNA